MVEKIDSIRSAVHTKAEINDRDSDEFIPGTLNIYSFQFDSEKHGQVHDNASAPKIKTKGNIILFPQPSNSVNDPLNWPRWRKLLNFFIIIFITAFTAATSNAAGASQDALNELYGISYTAMNTGAGVLFLGIGWGTFFLTPLSSLYGRKITYFICILLGLLGSIWFALIKRTTDSVWSQLFVGISESCAEAQVQLSLSELYFSHNLGNILTYYIIATSVGTYLGPLIGSIIVEKINFRWTGWIAVIISGGLLLVIMFLMDETYFNRAKYFGKVIDGVPDVINDSDSDEKAEKNSSEGLVTVSREINQKQSNMSLYNYGENEPLKPFWIRIQLITFADNLQGWGIKQYFQQLGLLLKVFLYPPVIFSGFVWGIQNALLTFYITVEDDQYYDPPYSFGDIKVGIMNVPCLIGAVIGCYFAGTLSDHFTVFLAKRNNGIQEAEMRLWFLFPPAIIAPVGLILFAVGTDQVWPWFPTYLGLAFIGFGFGCSGDVAMSYLMDAYPEMVIEMMTGVALINNMIGCIFTFACSPWLNAMGATHTFIILAVIEFVIMLCAIPFIIYGKRIRRWTKDWYLEFCQLRDGI